MYCTAAAVQSQQPQMPMTPVYHSDSSPDGSPPAEAYHSMRTTPSPTPVSGGAPVSAFTALYFAKGEEHPRIVNINCLPPSTPGSAPRPVVSNYLPSSGGVPPTSVILKQGLGCQLRYPLAIYYCPGSNTTNRSIWRLTGGQAQRPWKGDVLVMKVRLFATRHAPSALHYC